MTPHVTVWPAILCPVRACRPGCPRGRSNCPHGGVPSVHVMPIRVSSGRRNGCPHGSVASVRVVAVWVSTWRRNGCPRTRGIRMGWAPHLVTGLKGPAGSRGRRNQQTTGVDDDMWQPSRARDCLAMVDVQVVDELCEIYEVTP